ncbi:ras-related and estrogen-regulated growth inhibitor-like protein [Brienomyrus brachyistius]|uniref:ras-related and estrogen-regulated growth inhibitor-like protein n=1 Tax=Brienomyrus brachyistius TaxID=42636 RepID=UPI0020B30C30|nr:ras-related and estrogen-regulated growth inhibitor-like protein [Brienomyrus brachyistius]
MIAEVHSRSHYNGKVMDASQQKVDVNILLVGAENVGKTALTVRFITRRFIGEYGDIDWIYYHSDRIDGREISFNIWDSIYARSPGASGLITEKQLQWADGFILVYSICDRSSFNVVRQQLQHIRHCKSKIPGTVPVIIVGNKRDLQHRRTVSSEEGRLLALSVGCVFFEISAAETYHGALLVFHELLDLIREARAIKKGTHGIKGIVRTMSAVFGRRRTE